MRRVVSGVIALLLTLSIAALVPSQATAAHGRAAADPAPARLIYFNGWGGLRLGMDERATWRTGMVSHQVSGCEMGYLMKPAYRDRGYIEWLEHRHQHVTVKRIIVTGSVDHTVAGAHVGTTLRELRRLYPRLSRVTRAAVLDHQDTSSAKDLWVAWTRRKWGTLNFQFAYGGRPRASAKVQQVVVSRKPDVYWGC